MELQYWNNGEPVLEDSGLGELKYWLNGEPYVVFGDDAGTNIQINIADTFKEVTGLQINIADSWKTATRVQQNIGDVWKDVF